MSLLVLQTALSSIHLVHVGVDALEVDMIAIILLSLQLLNVDIVSFSRALLLHLRLLLPLGLIVVSLLLGGALLWLGEDGCWLLSGVIRMATTAKITRAPSTTLQRFELFIGVPQILILGLVWCWCVTVGAFAISSLAGGFSRWCCKTLLKESDWRVLGQVLLLILVKCLCCARRASPIILHFLLVVEELALEAWVRVDDTAFRLDVAHGLEQTPIFLVHQICDDACGRARLPSVTVEQNKRNSQDYAQFFIDIDEDDVMICYLPVYENSASRVDTILNETDSIR